MNLTQAFVNLSPVMQALIATLLPGSNGPGAAAVFFDQRGEQKLLDSMLAFAGGVAIAASYWSCLLLPSRCPEGKPIPGFRLPSGFWPAEYLCAS